MTSFKHYCYVNDFYTKDVSNTTHLFMDGGKLHIPMTNYPNFLNMYLKSINNGEKISLIEKLGKNCIMRFFLDIDHYINIDNILDKAIEVTKCDKFSIFKCCNDVGIHIVFNMSVTNEIASKYCEDIKKIVSKTESSHIDSSVYNTGLRMIGSVKFQNGNVIDRHYIPLNCNVCDKLSLNDLKSSIVRIKTNYDYLPKQCIKQTFKNTNVLLPYCGKINKEYLNIEIKDVKQIDDHISISTNSRFCCNINNLHKSCGIYFVINPKNEMYQKCYCPCQTSKNRKFGYCSQFRSKTTNVPKYIIKSLFV